jgi:uridine phosphorylase
MPVNDKSHGGHESGNTFENIRKHIGMSTESNITYPNYPTKHAEPSLVNPADFLDYLRRIGQLEDFEVPRCVILCYQHSLYERILAMESIPHPDKTRSYRGLVMLPRTDHRVGVLGDLGYGAAGAASALEELIALGVTEFVSIGTAGSLQPALRLGQVIVCERAIRDEGISHHYLPAAKHAEASPRLSESLRNEFYARGTTYMAGESWTIDAPYRETVGEARQYRREGVLCVEMESAAIFAIGKYRSVNVASVFVISDSIADQPWQPQWHRPEIMAALIAVYDVAAAVLADGSLIH